MRREPDPAGAGAPAAAGTGPEDDEAVAGLVLRAAAGDRLAWEGLVDRFGGVVWAVARGFRLSTSDCGDVSQATWLRLVEHIDRLRDPARVGAWLATTARRECLRCIARRDRWVLSGDGAILDAVADAGPAVDDALLAQENAHAVREALGTLPPAWRRLMELLMADPCPSYDEISRRLGMPVGSIGPTRGRCLERMRAAISA